MSRGKIKERFLHWFWMQYKIYRRREKLEFTVPKVTDVLVTDDTLKVDLSDGRAISVPLAWFPRLIEANKEERSNWKLIGDGFGIHWIKIDEDISVISLLTGKPSGESPNSLKKWLKERKELKSK